MQHSGSTAVWCTGSKKESINKIEVHINYWKTSKTKFLRKKIPDYIEIGIKAIDAAQFKEIFFFIPSKIHKNSVYDCGHYFTNARICEGIFNKSLSITTSASNGPTFIELKSEQKLFCRVLPFKSISQRNDNLKEAEFLISHKYGGTVFKITKHAIREVLRDTDDTKVDAYFRFRIDLGINKCNPFIEVNEPSDRPFVSGFEKIEYIDFRLNEARTLNEDIKRKLSNNGQTKISLVAFLTATHILSKLATSNKRWHKSRLLENDIWKEYISGGLKKGMMVYHWKAEAEDLDKDDPALPIQDFSAFVKLQTRESNWLTIGLYLILFFGISVLASCAADYIPKAIKEMDSRAQSNETSSTYDSKPQTLTGDDQ